MDRVIRVKGTRPASSRSLAAATHIYLSLLDENWDNYTDDHKREILKRALRSAGLVVPAMAEQVAS